MANTTYNQLDKNCKLVTLGDLKPNSYFAVTRGFNVGRPVAFLFDKNKNYVNVKNGKKHNEFFNNGEGWKMKVYLISKEDAMAISKSGGVKEVATSKKKSTVITESRYADAASTKEQKTAIDMIERALKAKKLAFRGGTTIGNNPQEVVLDVFEHYGGEVRVDGDGNASIDGKKKRSVKDIRDAAKFVGDLIETYKKNESVKKVKKSKKPKVDESTAKIMWSCKFVNESLTKDKTKLALADSNLLSEIKKTRKSTLKESVGGDTSTITKEVGANLSQSSISICEAIIKAQKEGSDAVADAYVVAKLEEALQNALAAQYYMAYKSKFGKGGSKKNSSKELNESYTTNDLTQYRFQAEWQAAIPNKPWFINYADKHGKGDVFRFDTPIGEMPPRFNDAASAYKALVTYMKKKGLVLSDPSKIPMMFIKPDKKRGANESFNPSTDTLSSIEIVGKELGVRPDKVALFASKHKIDLKNLATAVQKFDEGLKKNLAQQIAKGN